MYNELIRDRVKIVHEDKPNMMSLEENMHVVEDKVDKCNEVLMACTDASVKDGHMAGHIGSVDSKSCCATTYPMI